MTHSILLLLLMGITWPVVSWAETTPHLDQLLRQVQKSQKQETATRREREQRFLAAHTEQEKLLAGIKARLAAQRLRSEQLRDAFDGNEKTLTELETELTRQAGDLGELFGTVRQSAKDFAPLISESLVSAQYPGRAKWLRNLGESKKLPDSSELEKLWHLVQQETVESGQVVRFVADVVATDGRTSALEVVRVGLFSALEQERYLHYQAQTGRFVVLARQPSRTGFMLPAVPADATSLRLVENTLAARLGIGNGGNNLAVDPTRGVLLSQLVETPSPLERLHQGGIVGYVILALGCLGICVVIIRLAYLAATGWAIRRQLRNPDSPSKNNPLGRILAVAAASPDLDQGNLELHVDEAILRELPRLTSGEGLIKLLAAVAPLLGLLGTVVGMIATFQAITLFGTGDPKMMADGISQALVTTAMGLIVAIPLLFMHTLVTSRSQILVQILDEQSLGLVASVREPVNA